MVRFDEEDSQLLGRGGGSRYAIDKAEAVEADLLAR